MPKIKRNKRAKMDYFFFLFYVISGGFLLVYNYLDNILYIYVHKYIKIVNLTISIAYWVYDHSIQYNIKSFVEFSRQNVQICNGFITFL